jgi:membrane protein YqaA with SNARE-associated domain
MTELLSRLVSPETIETAGRILEAWGPWSVLAMALLVGFWRPIAPDFLILAAGILGRSPYPLALMALPATGVGALFGYFLGNRLGAPLLARVFRSRPDRLERIERMFDRRGIWAVSICAVTPIPMKYSLWMSGALRLPLARYFLAVYAGYIPRIAFITALSQWMYTA